MGTMTKAVLGAVAPVIGQAALARAQVSVYADLIEDIQGDSLVQIATGSAEDGQCQGTLTIDVQLWGPGGSWLGSTAGQDWCYASAEHRYTQSHDSFVNGSYEARAVASGAGGASGCASQIKLFAKYEGRYYYVGQGEQGHEYYADACAHRCQLASTTRSTYQGLYLWDRGWNVEVGGYGTCRHNFQGSTQRGLCTPP